MTRSGFDLQAVTLGRERAWWIAQLALLALAIQLLWGVLGCLAGCYADVYTIFGAGIGRLSEPDMRLNSWILAWVQRALTRDPAGLFDANAFHPGAASLTGSEHMLGVAIPLLPLAPFGPSAVLLHQTATLLSFLVMGWTTFALTRWLTGSHFAAFVAAAAAMLMPWRIFELAHVQLLSAHWIPLIWLLVGKILTGDAHRRAVPLLALVLLLQLGSSYYLAFYTSASIAVLVPVLALRHGLPRERGARLLAALALAYVPFVLISLPYLQREGASDLVLLGAADPAFSLAEVLAFLAGNSSGPMGETSRLTYQVPLCVLALAALGALLGRLRVKGTRTVASFSLALWLMLLTAGVFVLGTELEIGERVVALPGRLAADWVPGFRHLRTPARWMLLVGVVAPVLAGIGVQRAGRALQSALSGRRAALQLVLGAALLCILALELPWQTLPVRKVGLESSAGLYEAVRALPQGPVLEIPWPVPRLREARSGSHAMLASTLHWKPILNGFAPYPPASYRFLHGLGWRLPAEDALAKLTRLAGLRWIVVHAGRLSGPKRAAWEQRVADGVLRRVYADPASWILEVVRRERAGEWLEPLRDPRPRARTFTGLGREPLAVAAGEGRLAVSVPGRLPVGAVREVFVDIGVAIENRTSRSWPGLDIQTEGLVQLRHRFLGDDGATVHEGVLPLHADVPARGSLVTRVLLTPPERPGPYRLQLALVQRIGAALVELAVPAVEVPVRVQPARTP